MKEQTFVQNLRARTLIMLALVSLALSGCGGQATGPQSPEPATATVTTVAGPQSPEPATAVAVPTTLPLPTQTVDISQARKAFEAGGELTYSEVVALKEEATFNSQLPKCRLKESEGWIQGWRNEHDKDYKEIPGLVRLGIYMYDPYAPASDNRSYPEMFIAEVDEKATAAMKPGQRISFSGGLAIVDEQVAVKNAKYQLLEDDFTSPTPTPDELRDLLITLERTACFGSCPDYTLTITGDGKASFEGRRYTKVIGAATTTIDQAKLIELVKEFRRADFFTLSDKYSANVTDNPTYTVTIQLGGKTKRVENYVAGPRKLYILQDRIDQIVNSDQWVK